VHSYVIATEVNKLGLFACAVISHKDMGRLTRIGSVVNLYEDPMTKLQVDTSRNYIYNVWYRR
jgi:hypothetical protein